MVCLTPTLAAGNQEGRRSHQRLAGGVGGKKMQGELCTEGLVLQGCNQGSAVPGTLLGQWGLALLGPEARGCWGGLCGGRRQTRLVGRGRSIVLPMALGQGRVDTASLVSMIDESPWKFLFSLSPSVQGDRGDAYSATSNAGLLLMPCSSVHLPTAGIFCLLSQEYFVHRNTSLRPF